VINCSNINRVINAAVAIIQPTTQNYFNLNFRLHDMQCLLKIVFVSFLSKFTESREH